MSGVQHATDRWTSLSLEQANLISSFAEGRITLTELVIESTKLGLEGSMEDRETGYEEGYSDGYAEAKGLGCECDCCE